MAHKLLLADDSVTIQRVIELTFADEDIQVIAVGNGQQAIERAERDRPDIVLADVGMPERDGYEVAAFIKGNPTLSHVPVVLLTGAFEPIDETRARAVGCDGVLVKPFEPQMVISRVKDLLAGRRPPGMWGSGPATQGPVRQATTDLDVRPPAAASGGGDPLEAYFDRLDAAFTALGSAPPADAPPPPPAPAAAISAPRQTIPLSKPTPVPPKAPVDDLASWDPDLEGDPTRPAAAAFDPFASAPPPPRIQPAPVPVQAAPPPPPPPAPPLAAVEAPSQVQVAPAPPAAVPPPSLVDAFAALLAAEQQLPVTPSAAPLAGSGGSDERFIEEVTSRVVARLSDQARPSILDVAERLVRDEIERIKQQNRT